MLLTVAAGDGRGTARVEGPTQAASAVASPPGASPPGAALSGRERARVHDRVRVALLGEEALPVLREVLVDGVARDERVERRRDARLLRAQQAAESLRLLLARPERPGHLDGD